MIRRCLVAVAMTAALAATAGCGSNSSGGSSATTTPSGQMILATTTSTRDTGLLDTLVPAFERASRCSVKTVAVGSGQAIDLGARGQADVLLVHLWRRDVGLVVPRGNPLGIRGVADLAGLRVAWRPRGSGSRLLLERLLAEAGVAGQPESGEPADSHFAVAAAVAAGAADAGLAVRAVARACDLDFVELTVEPFELAVRADAVDSAAGLLARLHDPAFVAQVEALGGYDMSQAGARREAA